MAKTFDQSLIDTAQISMSMLDVDDIADTTSEEFASLRREQQGCHNELTHRDDFPFGFYVKRLSIQADKNSYGLPTGQVKEVWLNGKQLTYIDNYLEFDDKEGKPKYYAVSENPEKLILYPTPTEGGYIQIKYYDDRFVEDINGDYQWEISIGSTLRMPENVQHLYFDALEYFLLADHIKKVTNARWQPTMQIAQARWKVFLNGAKKTDNETYFRI